MAVATLASVLAACGNKSGTGPAPFESAPYVQAVTTSSAVVAQATRFPTALEVVIAPASGGRAARAREPEAGYLHRVGFEGLEPDTLYSYRVVTDGTVSWVSSFRTPPPPGRRTVTFAALGDSGGIASHPTNIDAINDIADSFEDSPEQTVVVRAILGSQPLPDFVIHTGDVVYPDGDYQAYREAFFDPFLPLIAQVPIFPVIGNHDAKTDAAQPWVNAFATLANNPERSPRYYSYDWGDVHVTCIDDETTPYGQGSPQWTFVRDDLASARAAWKLVVVHRPLYDDGRHGDDQSLIDAFQSLFAEQRVAVVLSGHDHDYQRFVPMHGFTQIVTGGGGNPDLYSINPSQRLAYGNTTFHFVRGTADARTLTLEAIDTKGIVLDYVTLTRGE